MNRFYFCWILFYINYLSRSHTHITLSLSISLYSISLIILQPVQSSFYFIVFLSSLIFLFKGDRRWITRTFDSSTLQQELHWSSCKPLSVSPCSHYLLKFSTLFAGFLSFPFVCSCILILFVSLSMAVCLVKHLSNIPLHCYYYCCFLLLHIIILAVSQIVFYYFAVVLVYQNHLLLLELPELENRTKITAVPYATVNWNANFSITLWFSIRFNILNQIFALL